MNARTLPATGRAAEENGLLSQLGLPPSAAPEDVDQMHEAVSAYLAAAPAGIRGWAHAQAAALDSAYLQLTDPVGFGGSALRSPTRPPRVVPGGPATPPARRALTPAPPASPTQDFEDEDASPTDDELEALYASVTPSAHPDMLPGPHRSTTSKRGRRRATVATMPAPQAAGGSRTRWLLLGGALVAAVIAVAVGFYNLGAGGAVAGSGNGSAAQASPTAPAVDLAKISDLMQKLSANPNDTATLLDLANEYYAGGEYDVAGQWLDKVLALDPKNVQALLARGAVSFNLGDNTSAEKTWQQVVALDPKNVEVHYDLGFLYLNQATPDWAGVQREWNLVIQLDPTSQLAATVKSHLDSLAAASMLPGASAGASAAPSASADASAAPSAAPSAAASPAASPAASTQP